MTTDEQIEACLQKVRGLLDGIGRLHSELHALQTIEAAQAEYASLLNDSTSVLSALERHKALLEEQLRAMEADGAMDDEGPPLAMAAGAVRQPSDWRPKSRNVPRRPAAPDHEAAMECRRRLKKLVNRWAYAWRLTGEVVGELNQIADDADRPLGEALVLLDWRIYAERVGPHESGDLHLERLREWQQALEEFRERLASQFDMLETRFRGWRGIGELWSQRERSQEDRVRWTNFIAEQRRLAAEKAAQLQQTTAVLESRLRALRSGNA